MKKLLKYFIPALVVIILGYLGYCMITLSKQQQIRSEKIANIPEFTLKDMTGQLFSNSKLKKGIPTVFFYFNTECEFCQAEVNDIVQNIQKFKDIQLVFVSFEPIQKIIVFQITYKLDIYNNIVFLNDYNNTFYDTFGIKNIPSSIVYDKDGKLLSRNNGAVKVDYLLKVLK